ncbi:MAG: hypothetical protein EOP49_08780 [Sphingobacteriales bacterium]|nr:MAG: hypothetical protein EOP49_08780 [Sphingobacteriales bacterium]
MTKRPNQLKFIRKINQRFEAFTQTVVVFKNNYSGWHGGAIKMLTYYYYAFS